ncbi:MAG: class II glutamine amidotransferase [Myxococcales bacterium]|nr:class II glutamine amidotransferase [Myxococcales bacterium]
MSFCFAFRSTDAALLSVALQRYETVLSFDDGAPNGWGLGYFQGGQPLLRKQPRLSGRLDFNEKAKNLRSRLLLGHRRGGATTPIATENTHPFRFHSWIFCHAGTVDHFDAIRDDILSAIPDFIRRNLRGKTDSEHLFHLFLAFLNDTGKLDENEVSGAAAGRALHAAIVYIDRLVRDRDGTPPPLCCMLTNGRVLLATRRGMPMWVTRQSGYETPSKVPGEKPTAHTHLKTVMLVGGVDLEDEPGWEAAEENAIVSVDGQLNIEYSTPSEE